MSEENVRRLLRRIQQEAGLDPDGPPRPLQPRPLREDVRAKLRRASEIAYRDAMLRRALQVLW